MQEPVEGRHNNNPLLYTYLHQILGEFSLSVHVASQGKLHPFLVIDQHLSGVDGEDRDVPDNSKVTTVVEVLILHTEEVPHKAPEDLHEGQDGPQDVALQDLGASLAHRDVQGPQRAENKIFNDCQAIVQLKKNDHSQPLK